MGRPRGAAGPGAFADPKEPLWSQPRRKGGERGGARSCCGPCPQLTEKRLAFTVMSVKDATWKTEYEQPQGAFSSAQERRDSNLDQVCGPGAEERQINEHE